MATSLRSRARAGCCGASIDIATRSSRRSCGRRRTIGAGACAQFVDEESERVVKTIELGPGDEGDWFGHFGEDIGDTLFVLGWQNVTAIDARLAVKWVSRNVAIDGITGGRVESGRLFVSAEMDPPGGWVDVELDVVNGRQWRRGVSLSVLLGRQSVCADETSARRDIAGPCTSSVGVARCSRASR